MANQTQQTTKLGRYDLFDIRPNRYSDTVVLDATSDQLISEFAILQITHPGKVILIPAQNDNLPLSYQVLDTAVTITQREPVRLVIFNEDRDKRDKTISFLEEVLK